MSDLLDRVVLPVAGDDDAAATARALGGRDFGSLLAVHVVEKAGGAPDKASVEQREEVAEEAFAVLRAALEEGADLETRILYGTDVADAIFDAADDYDASAIAITPRGGSRWIQLLTGDVALSLVTETDRPVVVLPDVEASARDGRADEDDPTAENDPTTEDGGSNGE